MDALVSRLNLNDICHFKWEETKQMLAIFKKAKCNNLFIKMNNMAHFPPDKHLKTMQIQMNSEKLVDCIETPRNPFMASDKIG